MQTFFHYLEIEHIHHFIAHLKSNLQDLLFILPKTTTKANDIQKTIIFVNTSTKICLIIQFI